MEITQVQVPLPALKIDTGHAANFNTNTPTLILRALSRCIVILKPLITFTLSSRGVSLLEVDSKQT